MQRREVRWERMFPDELEAAFEECPIAYLPYGLCEPHGPQNALGMDALRAHSVLCLTARTAGGIVAPPEYWHCHEAGIYGSWACRENRRSAPVAHRGPPLDLLEKPLLPHPRRRRPRLPGDGSLFGPFRTAPQGRSSRPEHPPIACLHAHLLPDRDGNGSVPVQRRQRDGRPCRQRRNNPALGR